MKKMFILSCASILMLTGCGATETLSCSFVNNAANGTTKVTYDIDHQEDEIKKVRVTYNYDFDNNNNGNNSGTTDGNNDGTTDGTTARDMTRDIDDTNTNDMNDTADLDGTADNNNNGSIGNNNATGDGNANNNITGYTNDSNGNNMQTDGVGTGTDGTTNDSNIDDDGIVDGVVGSAIDTIVGGVTSVILDAAGLRDRHSTVQNTYGNVAGFSVQNTNDVNNNYRVTYVIDYDTISDNDLATFNFSRDLNTMRNNYVNQGFTCK